MVPTSLTASNCFQFNDSNSHGWTVDFPTPLHLFYTITIPSRESKSNLIFDATMLKSHIGNLRNNFQSGAKMKTYILKCGKGYE